MGVTALIQAFTPTKKLLQLRVEDPNGIFFGNSWSLSTLIPCCQDWSALRQIIRAKQSRCRYRYLKSQSCAFPVMPRCEKQASRQEMQKATRLKCLK